MQPASPQPAPAEEGRTNAQRDAALDDAWFDAPPPSGRRSSVPPPPVEAVGDFLGDPLADAWLR